MQEKQSTGRTKNTCAMLSEVGLGNWPDGRGDEPGIWDSLEVQVIGGGHR